MRPPSAQISLASEPSAGALRQLVGIIQELSTLRDVARIAAVVCRSARGLIGCDGAAFILREDGRVRYLDEDSVGPLWKGQSFDLDACICGWCIVNRSQVVIPDVSGDPRINFEIYRETFVSSLAVVPVRSADPVAAVAIYWSAQHAPTADEVDLLQCLADAAAVAVENARLHAEAQAEISRRIRIEHELRSAMTAAEAGSRAKSLFLATMSHEIRTPMHGILGLTEILLDSGLDETSRDMARTIHDCGRSLLVVINGILDYSRIESGRIELHAEPMDPVAAAAQVVGLMRPQAEAKGLDLHLAVSPDLPALISGDAVRIQQVLTNLLGNAVKFTDRGSVTLRLSASGAQLRFAVIDTGIGIARCDLPLLFRHFSQVDGSQTRRHGGTGLGLAISRGLADAMGGSITVESWPGHGSEFTFCMPLHRMPAQPPVAPARRVLLVEDDQVCRQVALGLLASLGIEADTALDGAAAVEAVRAGGPWDTVLMDLEMPVLDGISATQAIRSYERSQDRPAGRIIALTAYASTSAFDACRAAGIDRILCKPIGRSELAAALGLAIG